MAENRRIERRGDLVALMRPAYPRVLDLSLNEQRAPISGKHRQPRARSRNSGSLRSAVPRTDLSLAREWADALAFDLVAFRATDRDGIPFYHTNVLMFIGHGLAGICLESITASSERKAVEDRLRADHREILPLTQQQTLNFCGNCLALSAGDGAPLWVMSSQAYRHFSPADRTVLERHGKILAHGVVRLRKARRRVGSVPDRGVVLGRKGARRGETRNSPVTSRKPVTAHVSRPQRSACSPAPSRPPSRSPPRAHLRRHHPHAEHSEYREDRPCGEAESRRRRGIGLSVPCAQHRQRRAHQPIGDEPGYDREGEVLQEAPARREQESQQCVADDRNMRCPEDRCTAANSLGRSPCSAIAKVSRGTLTIPPARYPKVDVRATAAMSAPPTGPRKSRSLPPRPVAAAPPHREASRSPRPAPGCR